MSAIGWQGRLNEALTPEAVTGVCNEFLGSMTREELDELPSSCRPRLEVTAGDVSPYALALIRQLGLGNRTSAPALHRLTTFFTKAALRLAQIAIQHAELAAERRGSRARSKRSLCPVPDIVAGNVGGVLEMGLQSRFGKQKWVGPPSR